MAQRVLKSLVHLVSVGRILERHDGNLRRVLTFEETREERQTLVGVFGCALLLSCLALNDLLKGFELRSCDVLKILHDAYDASESALGITRHSINSRRRVRRLFLVSEPARGS